ncbi:MAG: hypothetical protein WD448_02595 [Woeseia sp.]
MIGSTEIPWLEPLAASWSGAAARGRPAHAVLLTGAPGVGKRSAAVWMARERLGVVPSAELPTFPPELPQHPDLYRVGPPEGKKAILIDQIRELVAELSLTSYEGAAKVALIDPANAMTGAAANSLLKTLEEPPGDALLVLVADRLGGLPATILSRCQRLNIAIPATSVSRPWLERLQPGADWSAALQAAGDAPLAAIDALECLEITSSMAREFVEIADGRLSPVRVAANWAKHDPSFVLTWMGREIQRCVHQACGNRGAASGSSVGGSVLDRIDRRNLFCYLDTINRFRSQAAGSFSVQLALESLLIDWAEGLQNCGNKFIRGGVLPIPEVR